MPNFNVFLRDNFRCVYCGRSSIEDGMVLHIDHVVPITSGGTGSPENVVTACADCNLRKSSKPLPDVIRARVQAEAFRRTTAMDEMTDSEILEAIEGRRKCA